MAQRTSIQLIDDLDDQPIETLPMPFAVTPRAPGGPEADLTGFTLIHRALRSGSRMLANATTGIIWCWITWTARASSALHLARAGSWARSFALARQNLSQAARSAAKVLRIFGAEPSQDFAV